MGILNVAVKRVAFVCHPVKLDYTPIASENTWCNIWILAKSYYFTSEANSSTQNIFIHTKATAYQTPFSRFFGQLYIEGLVQNCSNSSALAMELLHICTNPSLLRFMVRIDRGLTKRMKVPLFPKKNTTWDNML